MESPDGIHGAPSFDNLMNKAAVKCSDNTFECMREILDGQDGFEIRHFMTSVSNTCCLGYENNLVVQVSLLPHQAKLLEHIIAFSLAMHKRTQLKSSQ